MTIGEKIIQLRMSKGISQEQLAEHLNVSRQSVSKWEMGQAAPQIDKIVQLSELFNVSCDELLKEDVTILGSSAKQKRNKYFGTEVFRGEANVTLTSTHA